MKNYSNIKELIQDLINYTSDDKNVINTNKFNEASLDGFIDSMDIFYKELTKFMHDEDKNLGHFGLRETDFPTIDSKGYQSIVQFINSKADLIDSFMDKCFIKNGDKISHWNESLQRLINIYLEMTNEDKFINDTNVKISDLLYADAGNSFNYKDNTQGWSTNGWVRPWMNIDGNSYSKERANDKIIRMLNNDNQLQFTRAQSELKNFIRLIMPKYERTVEIEDLDRNFWVIGQVLTAIYSYLWHPDNQLSQLLKGIADEISQLWENVLYLWTAFVLLSQNLQYKNIETIFMPIENFGSYPYVKFDDFNIENVDVSNKLAYLKDNFTDSILIIIPEVRTNNYAFNYYSKVIYPGIIIRQMVKDGKHYRDEYIYKPFSKEISEDLVDNDSLTFIEEDDYTFKIHKYYENTTKGTTLVSALRTIPQIDYNVTDNNELIDITISLNFYDVGAAMENKNIALYREVKEKINLSNQGIFQNQLDEIYKLDVSNVLNIEKENCSESFYRGEICSWEQISNNKFNLTVSKTWDFSLNNDVDAEKNRYSAKFSLRKNGKIQQQLTLNGASNGQIVFSDLDAYEKDGVTLNNYALTEEVYYLGKEKEYNVTKEFNINPSDNINITSQIAKCQIKNIYNIPKYEIETRQIWLEPFIKDKKYQLYNDETKTWNEIKYDVNELSEVQNWTNSNKTLIVSDHIHTLQAFLNNPVIKKNLENTGSEHKIYIYIALRACSVQYTEGGEPKKQNEITYQNGYVNTFFKTDKNNNLEQYSAKTTIAGGFACCAMVVIPINGVYHYIECRDFKSVLNQWNCGGTDSEGINYSGSFGLTNSIIEIFCKAGERLDEDNWILKYTQVDGHTIDSCPTSVSDIYNKNKEDVQEDIRGILKGTPIIPFAQLNKNNEVIRYSYSKKNCDAGIATSMMIAYIRPNGDCNTFCAYRKEEESSGAPMLNEWDIKYAKNWNNNDNIKKPDIYNDNLYSLYYKTNLLSSGGVLMYQSAVRVLDEYKTNSKDTNQPFLDFERFPNNGLYNGTLKNPSNESYSRKGFVDIVLENVDNI